MNEPLITVGLLLSMALTAEPETPARLTNVVPKLKRIEVERRVWVSKNPYGLSPTELNRRVPEIDGIELSNAFSDTGVRGTLKVIAWNLERGGRWREAAALIESHPALQNPDILFLSEMDLGMPRSGNVHTTASLARQLRMNYAYVVEFLELTKGSAEEIAAELGRSEEGCHGNAILSRFPLTNLRALRFPGIETWYGSDEHRLGGRNAIFAEIEVAGKSITLVSTHLESGALDNAVRARQISWILGELAHSAPDQPVILGGDLNSPPFFPAIRRLEEAGFDVAGCNRLSEPTTQKVVNGRVIRRGLHLDYLAPRGLAVAGNEMSPTIVLAAYPDENGICLSDHAIVVCELGIEGLRD